MATSTNVYVLTEKPPTLGRIDGKRAGEQIQEFLRELAKYTRLHVRDGVQIPSLFKLMVLICMRISPAGHKAASNGWNANRIYLLYSKRLELETKYYYIIIYLINCRQTIIIICQFNT